MKIFKISSLLIILLLISCNKEDNQEAIESLSGHWHVLSFEPDDQSDTSLLAQDVITTLEQRGCDPIEFTFKSDGTFSYTNRMSLLSATSDGESTDVDCVWEGGIRTGMFNFDYEALVLIFDNETIVYKVTHEGEYITIMTDDLVLNGQTVSGKLLFKQEAAY